MKALIYISMINLFSSLFTVSFAEYRAYQYLIKDGELDPSTIISSLPTNSYIAYYGSKTSFKIDLLRTWMCPGNTANFKAICPSPYKNAEAIKKIMNQ